MTRQQEIKLETYIDKINADRKREALKKTADSLTGQCRQQAPPRFIMTPKGIHKA